MNFSGSSGCATSGAFLPSFEVLACLGKPLDAGFDDSELSQTKRYKEIDSVFLLRTTTVSVCNHSPLNSRVDQLCP